MSVAITGLSIYSVGAIWTLYVFGPVGGAWALAGPLCLALGMIIGYVLRPVPEVPLLALIGLYVGWFLRLILIGDLALGRGIEFMMAGMASGMVAGFSRARNANVGLRAVLIGAVLGGFAGALLGNWVFGSEAAWLSLAAASPAVIACGIVGAIVARKLVAQ